MSIGRSTRKYLDNPLEEVLGSQPDAKDEIILKLTKENKKLKKAEAFLKDYVQFCERDYNRRRNTFYLDARRILKELEGV